MNSSASAGCRPAFRTVSLPRHGFDEVFVTGPGRGLPALHEALEHLGPTHANGGGILRAEAFIPTGPDHAGVSEAWSEPPLPECPVTCVLGESPENDYLGGVHLHAINGIPVTPLKADGRVLGTLIETPYATEVMLGDIRPATADATKVAQARRTFELMEEALAVAQMDFSHVVRTWLFLDDILDWYDDFNPVRTEFFNERGVFDRMVPASTGIGGSNPAGTAMVTALYAVKPKVDDVVIQAVPSPLQCPALEYGSSFSRAAEVAMPDHRRLFVSGTASIAPGGETVYVDDVEAQVEQTCKVVGAILESREMQWSDVTRATAYVRYPKDAAVLDQFCAASGMPSLPVVIANNVICRDDLLFELEVDAVRPAE